MLPSYRIRFGDLLGAVRLQWTTLNIRTEDDKPEMDSGSHNWFVSQSV
jgi:hypothetical protein